MHHGNATSYCPMYFMFLHSRELQSNTHTLKLQSTQYINSTYSLNITR